MGTKITQSPKTNANVDSITSRARIRDNQRRSRARRKEYIHDLEQRLRRFESLGVEATLEVQAAGRKVAAENALLRSLLRQHGVSEEQIQDYLESHTANDSPFNPPLTKVPRLVISPLPGTQSDQLGRHSVLRPSSCLPQMDNSLRETSIRRIGSLVSDSVANRDGNVPHEHTSNAEQPTTDGFVSPGAFKLQQPRGRQYTGHSTPCETAARIITTMRGCQDTHDVRAELGCHSQSNCMVRNMDIFEILDK